MCSEGSGADAAASTGTAAGVVAAATAAAAAYHGSKAGIAAFGADGFAVAELDETASSCEGSIVDADCVPSTSLLDTALLAMWEERAEQGLFR